MSVDKTFQISDDYKLGADTHQYIIYKKRIVEDVKSKNFGQEVWDYEAYLPRIRDVISYLAEIGIKENIDDLYAALDWVTNLENKVEVFDKARKYRESLK